MDDLPQPAWYDNALLAVAVAAPVMVVAAVSGMVAASKRRSGREPLPPDASAPETGSPPEA